MKNYDIIALGESLIDFTYAGMSKDHQKLFEQNPGGAPANVLSVAARADLHTAFIGKVGDDMHGDFLRSVLNGLHIDTTGLIRDREVFTTLAFVALSDSGEREFSFARKPGADTCLTWEDVNKDLLENTKIFHVGSLSLTDEPARGATIKAVSYAKSQGAVISYDPNYRAGLWRDEKEASVQMRSILPFVDIIKISDEETLLMTDQKEPKDAIDVLLGLGIKCCAVTLGAKGALVGNHTGVEQVAVFEGKVVDTTGAGDAFWGGFLTKIVALEKDIAELSLAELREFARYANAAATLCVGRRGAILAMPTKEEIAEVLSTP